MGISGLLPALKAIQVIKPLSEFSGQTIAVDAYVWLHKGVYSCATELATGKSTHKYVDYAMHRVRLLRHHGIEPYIVFDGGPLPAKKGTEKERKQKREESRARGKALLAQGDSQQARDHFIKCVDVTPEMAYQFIKSLRAEAVSYVVAPYEADAQLAYLERTGIVDAILTEDSDLLVFGCQTVLFKLDAVASTVMSISRKDFGYVTATSGDPSGISLLGWSDTQFRAMTILSGCDYLPSIPGIGLKTACNLLRKWKTPEQAIRAVAMEGKKSVPPNYLKQFRLAEKCFLHQRVYCPKAERLVHLTDVGDDWDADFDAYVGIDMDPVLAKNIAIGAANPDTYLPMKDINEDFKPRALKALVPISNNPAKSLKAQGKMREILPQSTKTRKVSTPGKATAGGILNFFGPNPVIPPRTKQKTPIHQKSKPNTTGKASGKRTLAEIMDQDMESKKKPRQSYPPIATQSKFFSSVTASTSQRRHSAGSSQVRQHEKENISLEYDEGAADCLEEASELDLDGSDLSLRANFDAKAEREMDLDPDDFPDTVEQEDGYISPSPSYSKDADELSSPTQASRFRSPPKKQEKSTSASTSQDVVHTGFMPSDDEDVEDNSFGADFISSPVSAKRPRTFNFRAHAFQTPVRWPASKSASPGSGTENVLVGDTPAPLKKGIYPDIDEVPSPTHFYGPDLRSMLGGYNDTELELEDHLIPDQLEEALGSNSVSSTPPSPSPETPALPLYMRQNEVQVVIDLDDIADEDEQTVREGEDRAKAVMIGWRERWALPSGKKQTGNIPGRGMTSPMAKKGLIPGSRAMQMKRSETNVTPSGLHSLAKVQPRSAPPKFNGIHDRGNTSYSTPSVKKNAAKPQRSLVFYEAVKQTNSSNVTVAKKGKKIVDLTLSSDFEDEIIMLV